MCEYVVEVLEIETNKVVKTMGPVSSERRAEKVDDGLNINLNHNEFYTQIVEVG